MTTTEAAGAPDTTVARFRLILLWPVRVMKPGGEGGGDGALAACLAEGEGPWRHVDDEFTGDPADFQERHYSEFVTFLPTAQRFLYGHGRGGRIPSAYGESPMATLRRDDVAAARVTMRHGEAPVLLSVAHVDLHFFYDIDVALLAVEVFADDLPLATAQDLMFRFGRAYPAFWTPSGRPGHCPAEVEWLSPAGAVLAASDYGDKRAYLDFACLHRAPGLAAHWRFLLEPMALDLAGARGEIRYRQLEYYRMPLMAFLAFRDPAALTEDDRRRLAWASAPATAGRADHGYDADATPHAFGPRQEQEIHGDLAGAWHAIGGNAVVLAGDAGDAAFMDAERGFLARFRHQYFLVFLIAHFHRASLLMFADELADAVSRLRVGDPAALMTFRQKSRASLERFLRFTHRYWIDEVTNHAETRAVFDVSRRQLQVDRLYQDVRQELHDMSQYLEGEAQRRQNTSMVRLTVVTTFGLTGALSTGFLGMNLFALDAASPALKLGLFALVFLPALALTLLTVATSARLSAFLDVLSDESLRLIEKARACFGRR